MIHRPPLIFDLGNVILDLDFDRFVQAAAAESIRTADAIRDRYITGRRKLDLERGLITGADFLDEMAAWLAWPSGAGDRDRLLRIWCDIFDPVPAAEVLIPRLAKQRKLWLLSDTNDLHWTFLEQRFGILQHFSRLFLSYRQGCMKSEPGAFAPILAGADCPADQLLFFDDIADNVAAARRAGLDAHLFRTWTEAENVIAG